MFAASKLGRLPPPENGGKEKDNGFLSKEKLLAKVEDDDMNVSLDKILLAKAGLVVAVRLTGCET